MASIRQLKSRIRSVKNTKQITKAMQMVAASKMRRAQDSTHASSPYAEAANELMSYLASNVETTDHPLFERRVIRGRMIIVIASDRGLAGAYNANLLKKYVNDLHSDDALNVRNQTIAVGRKAARFVTKIKDTDILGAYEDIADHPDARDIRTIVDTAVKSFESGEVDAVDVIFTKFKSAINQTVTVQRILPAGYQATEVSEAVSTATYEPSPEVVLDAVLRRLVEAQVFQAFLEAKASEYSMRMVAMKNATDNASDLTEDLTLEMNKERQAAITQELAEISGGVEAMND